MSEATGASISRSSTCLSEVKGPELLMKRHTLLLGDRLDAISSWTDLSGRLQTAGKASAPPTPQWTRDQGARDPGAPLDLLKPENADQITIKIADLGNACWVVSGWGWSVAGKSSVWCESNAFPPSVPPEPTLHTGHPDVSVPLGGGSDRR